MSRGRCRGKGHRRPAGEGEGTDAQHIVARTTTACSASPPVTAITCVTTGTAASRTSAGSATPLAGERWHEPRMLTATAGLLGRVAHTPSFGLLELRQPFRGYGQSCLLLGRGGGQGSTT